ncbi:MAG: pyridoxal phosphate-dependent aminotransferase [Gemmatimonadaceae bacterium]
MVSRRTFVKALGAGGAGMMAAPLLAARGREAEAAEIVLASPTELSHHVAARARRGAPGAIRIDSNENPTGPGAAAMERLAGAFGEIPRYPDAPADELRAAIATLHGTDEKHVVLGCGSSELLRMAVYAHCAPGRALVTASPTFEDAAAHAERLGAAVRRVRVRPDLSVDLGGMAREAPGAGLVYLCNPNNPTGGAHSGADVAEFVRAVLRSDRDVVVLVDEAYHEYVDAPGYASVAALALAEPRVIVARTFSKLHGLAGLRVGYALGHPTAIARLSPQQLPVNVNVLAANAALGALSDPAHVEAERARNREVRDFTRTWFEGAGFAVAPAAANFLMADVRRPAKEFQASCKKLGVLVGRPFPPLDSWARVSMGTMEEMQKAVGVFGEVLGARG